MKEKYGITKEGIVKVEIKESFLPDNPLSDDWLFGHLAFHHRGWDLDCPQPWEALEALGKKEGIEGLDSMSFDDISFALTARGYAIQPVYLLDLMELAEKNEHSGIAMTVTPFNDRWDSRLVGFIYMTPDELDEYHLSHEEGLRELTKTVDVLSFFYSGQVYDADVFKLYNTKVYMTNQYIVEPDWSKDSFYGVCDEIGSISDILNIVKDRLDIVAYFDNLDDAVAECQKMAKASHKAYRVKVTQTVTQELEVFADSEDEVRAMVKNNNKLLHCDAIDTKIDVEEAEQFVERKYQVDRALHKKQRRFHS